jgi:CO/xanthine dehydrogenase Mo-binding subunit
VPLAKEKVRHAGEPIAMVIAESRYIAEDALADIAVELEPLPAVVDPEKALVAGSPLVHDDVGSNVAAWVRQTKGNYAAGAAAADRIIRCRLRYSHGISSPIETRGVVAHWDGRAHRLTVWDSTQAPVFIRNGLAGMLGLSERQVRVIAPFVGGGFGPKIMMFYPEEVLLPWAAMRLGRPIKWIEDRREHFFATSHERGQIHDAEIALTRDGKILGIKDVFLHDTGAYDPYGLTVPINSQCTLLGPYMVPSYDSTFTAVFTNLPIVTPYRGAGRQHGVFVIERLLDFAARDLGIDRIEIRRRNFIAPDAFPYNNEIIYQDFAPLEYDSGNYAPALDKALAAIGYNQFIEDVQPRLRADGRHVGIAVTCYVEGTGIGPYEGAKVQVQANGQVSVATGIGTQGQGHFIVEIDSETLSLKILKYVVVRDCGTVINPLILAGQIQGGVAQGIGNAFYEQLAFDNDGQLRNASLADYLLPTSLDIPAMELVHTITPSPLNPLGIKGAGEAGAIPVGPLFAQAIEDALALGEKVKLTEIPLSPARLWELIAQGK